jgi:ribosomal protein S18 acetylase RimI-like enzyme
MRYSIRPLSNEDEPFLWEMLYQALYVPAGEPPFPPEIVRQPELSRYVADWGRRTMSGFSRCLKKPLSQLEPSGSGCCKARTKAMVTWDDTTPELTIALQPTARGQGVGTQLMLKMLAAAREKYPALSLSVSVENPARRLYQRLGFETVGQTGASLTMKLKL